MKQYMENYINETQQKMSEENVDYRALLDDFDKHLSFFMHERLVHLLVMILFALLTVVFIAADIFCFSIAIFILSLIFIVMTAAYIKHYYFLENTVQKMYKIYDTLYKLCCKKNGGNRNEDVQCTVFHK